jgi:hypothetical protein
MRYRPIAAKKNQTKSVKAPFYKQRWVVVLLIVALLVFGWLIFKEWRLEHNKRAAKTQVEQVITTVNDLPGQSVNKEVEDAGCYTGNTKLGKRTVCNYYGERVFRASGNIIDGKKTTSPIKPIQTKKLNITWKGSDIHIDDEIINKGKEINLTISLLHSLLEIIVNKEELK